MVALIRLQERMASAEESMKEIDEVAAMRFHPVCTGAEMITSPVIL